MNSSNENISGDTVGVKESTEPNTFQTIKNETKKQLK